MNRKDKIKFDLSSISMRRTNGDFETMKIGSITVNGQGLGFATQKAGIQALAIFVEAFGLTPNEAAIIKFDLTNSDLIDAFTGSRSEIDKPFIHVLGTDYQHMQKNKHKQA